MKDAMNAVNEAKRKLAEEDTRSRGKSGVVRGTIGALLFVLCVGAFAGALYYDRTQDHAQRMAARPAIPVTYHAYVPEDTVVSSVLDKPDLSSNARVESPKHALVVPVGYGGDTLLSSAPCWVSYDGWYTQLGVYDERHDGHIDGVIVVYTAPTKPTADPGTCQSGIVAMVVPEYQFFD